MATKNDYRPDGYVEAWGDPANDPDAEMFGTCPDCGSEECEDWSCHEDEFERALEHDENESDDNPPMFSVAGRLWYDKASDKFSYWDEYAGKEVKLSW